MLRSKLHCQKGCNFNFFSNKTWTSCSNPSRDEYEKSCAWKRGQKARFNIPGGKSGSNKGFNRLRNTTASRQSTRRDVRAQGALVHDLYRWVENSTLTPDPAQQSLNQKQSHHKLQALSLLEAHLVLDGRDVHG